MARTKQEVISFKADQGLIEAMQAIPNRSEFIRQAILQALDNVCPLCQGTGILSHDQQKHWREFSRDHAVAKCEHCHEARLVCLAGNQGAH